MSDYQVGGEESRGKEASTRRRSTTGIILVVALPVALFACTGAEPSASIEATVHEFEFVPNEWTVPAGQQISIDITNDGAVLHEWVLLQEGVTIDDEADLPPTEEELLADFVYVEEEVEAGETKTLTFDAPPPGTYQVICAIETHFDAGMEGTLTVEE